MLGGLKQVLAKAEAHVLARKIDPDALLQARLFPDLFTPLRQVQVASDFAKRVSARIAGVEVPALEDSEQTFAELQARIDTVLAFIDGLDEAGFADGGGREIVTQAETPREKRFTGTTAWKSERTITSALDDENSCSGNTSVPKQLLKKEQTGFSQHPGGLQGRKDRPVLVP